MVERFHFAGQRAEVLQDRVADGFLQAMYWMPWLSSKVRDVFIS